MESLLVRWLIQLRLDDGRLPSGRIIDLIDSAGDGQPCDGCGEIITKVETAVTGLSAENWRSIRLHPSCFRIWDRARLGRPSALSKEDHRLH